MRAKGAKARLDLCGLDPIFPLLTAERGLGEIAKESASANHALMICKPIARILRFLTSNVARKGAIADAQDENAQGDQEAVPADSDGKGEAPRSGHQSPGRSYEPETQAKSAWNASPGYSVYPHDSQRFAWKQLLIFPRLVRSSKEAFVQEKHP